MSSNRALWLPPGPLSPSLGSRLLFGPPAGSCFGGSGEAPKSGKRREPALTGIPQWHAAAYGAGCSPAAAASGNGSLC